MARNVPPDELDITTLRWVLGRLGTPDFVPVLPTNTASNLPAWDPALDCRVQLNPALLPLSGDEPERIAVFLRNVAKVIEEGEWNTYLFILQKGRHATTR